MPLNGLDKIRSMERFLDLKICRENELKNIVTLAAETCQVAAAFLVISVEGEITQHFKFGNVAEQLDIEDVKFDIPLEQDRITEVEDFEQHTQLAHHQLVKNAPSIRFFAGAPLVTYDGQHIGSLFVLGSEAKKLSERRKRMLHLLSRQAVTMVEFELSIDVLREQYTEAKNSENKLRSFFESSKSSHLLIGRNMEIITFNKTFYDIAYMLFGKPVLAGVKATEFIYPAYIDDFEKNVQTALSGESINHERAVKFTGIDPMWFKVSYNPTYDSGGKIIGVSFNSTDITQRKQSEQKILEQNEALRKVAFMQSHQLRKPVASILGLMSLLKLEETEANSAILNMMEQAVQELDFTVRNIVKATETRTDFDPLPQNLSF
ncbi:PAS domain S-box protein [Mucilaginibacter sp. HME9299]|uniref:histidine kinase n=2 Tax=Mucilaginibacter aquatilis TaxID=1517760 RepID=A0A6I4IRI2_9SPHI|nr:PAS domain S-box protein [Mucilaginibacter aquatilis]